MCTTWNQDQWINVTNNLIAGYENNYNLLDTRYNAQGQRAITVQETFGDKDVRNIYSEDGHDAPWFFGRNRKANAAKALVERGFTYETDPTTKVKGLQVGTVVLDEAVEVEATQANATVALVDTDPSTVTSPEQITDDMVVQGRTIAQWEEESKLNEDRDPKDHVHPEVKGDEPTALELAAFIASTTVEESIALMLMSMAGATSGLVPSRF